MPDDVRYEITPEGRTVIENYNTADPFASFLPAVAGLRGIPSWAFYVNRGQCICSFGVADRDHAMLEFASANVAYRRTPTLGFRTFLKVRSAAGEHYREPFRDTPGRRTAGRTQRMTFDAASVHLLERDESLGIETAVTFMTVPGETFPALARRVEVRNVGGEAIDLDCVDGLPWVAVYGIDYPNARLMTYTSKGWIQVTLADATLPYYQLRCVISDDPNLEYYEFGNYAIRWDESGVLAAIVDPRAVFGSDTSLDTPMALLDADDYTVPAAQATENDIPAAMTHVRRRLAPGESLTLHGVFGRARGTEALAPIRDRVTTAGWFDEKLAENRRVIEGITGRVATFSGERAFDGYVGQTFLDNTLRGGLPVTLPDSTGRKRTFHVFSRIHGDMERDYNFFVIEPAFWSQGNGAYRDMLQNRRNDVYVNPDVGESNIRTFMNYLRIDGYNPSGLQGTKFVLDASADADDLLAPHVPDADDRAELARIVAGPFTPGDVLTPIARRPVPLSTSPDDLLADLIARCEQVDLADPVSGFWTDHWHYNLDSIERYLSLWPDRAAELFAGGGYTFFQSPAVVRPRSRRYVLRDGEPFQADAIEVRELPAGIGEDCVMRTDHGRGRPYRTTLLTKLLSLAAVKTATLDPFGVGIEMEAGRPNWNDSLIGVTSFFRDPETMETLRLVRMCLNAVAATDGRTVKLPRETAKLVDELSAALAECGGEDEASLLAHWERTNDAKEHFREATWDGIDGDETELAAGDVETFLRACEGKLERGIARGIDERTGLMHGYFRHEMVEYDTEEVDGRTVLQPRRWRQIPTAPFLEGPMHYLRTCGARDAALAQHRAVRNSELYDRPLKMYRVCGSLADEPYSLGRVVAFTAGWLERESIYLHMQYKYLLELLRSGLHEEFFEAFRDALIPFQPPERYRRSVLENSSFLVCSDYPDATQHGRGFYARLSGSTAELVHLWLTMGLGERPFEMDGDGELVFRPCPSLPEWLFSDEARTVTWRRDGAEQSAHLPPGHYAFAFLGRTLIVYVNPTGKPTAGPDAVVPQRITLADADGNETTIECGCIVGEHARLVREGAFRTITVTLG